MKLVCLLLCGIVVGTGLVGQAGERFNLVLILADDMGAGDLRANNVQSAIDTPNLDALAAGGMRFIDAHSPSSVCSPTRYGLLTGRYAWRTRMTQGVLDGFAPPLIEAGRPNLASLLKEKNYRTVCFGKWHLGMQWTGKDGKPVTGDLMMLPKPGFRPGHDVDFSRAVTGGPTAIGFDEFFGISASLDMAPYAWIESDRCRITRPIDFPDNRGLLWNISPGVGDAAFEMSAMLGELQRRTVNWIEEHDRQADDRPFFLYLPLNSPHLPVVPSETFAGRSRAGSYGDFVMETDAFVGAVVAALRRTGELERTIIVFTSDNGGLWHAWEPAEADDLAAYRPTARALHAAGFGHRSNAWRRGTKADIYEGGHCVPFLVHWPDQVRPGSTCATPVELTDILATVADLLGAKLPEGVGPDSFSFLPLLRNPESPDFTRPFLVHHSLDGLFAIRKGDWKYAEARGSGGFSSPKKVTPEPGEATGQLYNLRVDPSETTNLFLREPARVAELQRLLQQAKAGEGLR